MEKQLKAAIDLLWVRPKQVGGIESYIRNLLDGLLELDDKFEFWLLVSQDNSEAFESYRNDVRIHLEICKVISQQVNKRIIWQNLYLGKKIKSLGLYLCFEPYYCKPFLGTSGIKFVTTIHDLQAIHYPEYFSLGKVVWMRFAWWNAVRTSAKIIAISNFVKGDILEHFRVEPDKISVLYNPISINSNELKTPEFIERKYNVKEKEFFFSVSSLLPHKNLNVLLEVIRKIKEEDSDLPAKLIISGVGGKSRDILQNKIAEYGLNDNVCLTAFIDNDERNALYKYSKAFLFPSIFEGFGMPPVEAMKVGTPVVTTRKASIEEVTQGKATYVNDPYNADEWISQIKKCRSKQIDFSVYDKKVIGTLYLEIFNSV